MEDSAFKLCPFCKEQIRREAIKCRFCGEWVEHHTAGGCIGYEDCNWTTPPPSYLVLSADGNGFLTTNEHVVADEPLNRPQRMAQPVA